MRFAGFTLLVIAFVACIAMLVWLCGLPKKKSTVSQLTYKGELFRFPHDYDFIYECRPSSSP